MHNGNFSIVYPYKKYFLYNADGNVGYYCEYSFKESLKLFNELRKAIKDVKKEYPNIVKYMNNANFDENYWNTIFKHK